MSAAEIVLHLVFHRLSTCCALECLLSMYFGPLEGASAIEQQTPKVSGPKRMFIFRQEKKTTLHTAKNERSGAYVGVLPVDAIDVPPSNIAVYACPE